MENKKRMRSEYFVGLANKVQKLPIMCVIGSLEQIYTNTRQPVPEEDLENIRGGNYMALCPFHADESLGSFVITPSKNMWWCFTEGIGWSTIHFEMRYFDLSFSDAVFHLAKRFSLLSEEEEKQYAGKKIDADLVKRVEVEMDRRKKTPQKKVDPKLIHSVYSTFPILCPLKEKHKKHLLKERHLSEEDLKDYFTVPNRNRQLAKSVYREFAVQVAKKAFPDRKFSELSDKELVFLETSKAMKMLKEELIHVPGFFKNGNKIDFSAYPGIGFLVRDDSGMVVGIQIRRDTVKEGESRYTWFSSSFAAYNDMYEGGGSPGAPGGVIFPKTDKENPALCITEGRFKAEQIAKKGNIAVYVSGVSSWRNIMPMIQRLRGDRKSVLVMFDADLMGNTAVHGQLIALCEELRKTGLAPYLVLWKIRHGKGFDDLVIRTGTSYKDKLSYVPCGKFEKQYRKALAEALSEMGVNDVRDIEKNKSQQFKHMLQNGVENAVCRKEEK